MTGEFGEDFKPQKGSEGKGEEPKHDALADFRMGADNARVDEKADHKVADASKSYYKMDADELARKSPEEIIKSFQACMDSAQKKFDKVAVHVDAEVREATAEQISALYKTFSSIVKDRKDA